MGVCVTSYTTGVFSGCTTVRVNYGNEPSQEALERSSQDAYDVIRLTRSKAAVWTLDDVARLIETDIVSRTGMLSIANQRTCGGLNQDKIFVNKLSYDGVKVVNSVVKSNHEVIISTLNTEASVYIYDTP